MIKMQALRELYESLGLQNPQSHIQSGNVLFRTKERNLVRLAERIESGIEQSFGFRPDVVLRTSSELRDIIARNPFAGRADVDASKLLVTFLARDPGEEIREKIRAIDTKPEELRIDGWELYTYFPNGVSKAKLPTALIERTLKTPGTARNWNTVVKLLEIAEGLTG